MSGLSKFSSFPPAGSPSWALGDDPVWRGGIRPSNCWWPVRSVWSADFAGDRYMRAGSQVSRAALLSCVRSSAATDADASGAVHTFGANEPVIVDGGNGVWGQFTQLLGAPFDFSNAAWTKVGATMVTQQTGYQLLADTDAAVTSMFRQILSHSADTLTRTAWVIFRKDGENSVIRVLSLLAQGGTAQSRLVNLNTSTGAYSANFSGANAGTLLVRDLGYGWLVAVSFVNNGGNTSLRLDIQPARNANIASGDNTANVTGAVGVYAAGMVTGTIFPPFLAAGTRLATDMHAAEMTWFEAAGLQSGCTLLAELELTRLADGVPRCIASLVADSGNRLLLSVNGSNKIVSEIRRAGSSVYTSPDLAIPAAGRLRVAARYADGAFRLRRSGDGTSVAANVAAMPLPSGLSSFYLGQNPEGGNYLNDAIRQLHVCGAMNDSEMDAWVAA